MAKKNQTKQLQATTHESSNQSFALAAPKATSVQLVGDFTNWQQKPIGMQKGPDGIWCIAVELSPGPHDYRFLVDGQWWDDPTCMTYTTNPFGSRNAVRVVA